MAHLRARVAPRNLFSCGSDDLVKMTPSDTEGIAQPLVRSIEDRHEDTITSLAMHRDHLATGCANGQVLLFSYPDLVYEGVMTKFSLAVRHVVFHPNGQLLVAAGANMEIRLVHLSNVYRVQSLYGHDHAIQSIAFDPFGTHMVSLDVAGTLKVWYWAAPATQDTGSSEDVPCDVTCIKSIAHAGHGSAHVPMLRMAYAPRGDYVAVPFHKKVKLIDCTTWREVDTLNYSHDQSVAVVSWCHQSQYLASIALDQQLVIWCTLTQRIVCTYQHTYPILDVAWSPKQQHLALIDQEGKVGQCKDMVQLTPAPQARGAQEGVPSRTAIRALDALFEDQAEEAVPGPEARVAKRKAVLEKKTPGVPRKQRAEDDDEDEDAEDDDDDDVQEYTYDEEDDLESRAEKTRFISTTSMQSRLQFTLPEAFQPTATPVKNKRQFLAWNMVGTIVSREDMTSTTVDIEFHDRTSFRGQHITDQYGFSMAALGTRGALLGCRGSTDGTSPSVIQYVMFEAWANSSEWTMALDDGEHVTCLCVGAKTAAIATSMHYVRLVSYAGIQLHVFSAPGPVIALSATDDVLLVVYNTNHAVPSYAYMVYNMNTRAVMMDTILPMSPNHATLKWVGFCEASHLPCTYDSQGIVRVALPDGQWVPVLDTRRHQQTLPQRAGPGALKDLSSKSKTHYWPIGITLEHFVCAILKGDDPHPSCLPRPITTQIAFKIPLLSLQHASAAQQQSVHLEERYAPPCPADRCVHVHPSCRLMSALVFKKHALTAGESVKMPLKTSKLIDKNILELIKVRRACPRP